MCVIIALPAKLEFPFDKLKNAALNNPDGFGIVTIDRGKLETIRILDEKGNDPEKVARTLENLSDVDRFIHLRHGTVGSVSQENVHPFDVFKSSKRTVSFMHNGTLTDFKPPVGHATAASDSAYFAETVLSPLLAGYTGKNGRADFNDPLIEMILSKFFSYTNRGLLLANDLSPLYLGKWDTIKVGEIDVKVSNTDYFNTANPARVRDNWKEAYGMAHHANPPMTYPYQSYRPGYGNQLGEPWKEEETVIVNTGSDSKSDTDTNKSSEVKPIIPLRSIELGEVGRSFRTDDFRSLMPDHEGNEVTDEDLTLLSMLTPNEFTEYCKSHPDEAGVFFEYLAVRYEELHREHTKLYEEMEEVVEKHDKATMYIAQMKAALN